ncbi:MULTISPECIES: conjugative transposon protein TraK [Chryseobacterium]|uniref:Conjugative transposon protein TraK n=1 Tax=Chryseobacterium pennae TaxID=2258962 RepID=A0A3D9C3K5_9FLAO|nr:MULTISPECIES: conjugative transposon protein TraK [Chryseobacterium]MDC8102642.1 conjugative transposon protein TraK [Chryseobacterium rhizosphaerae]REC60450.1 conjugative transposon protein TraK [Chryseobacterium pennae]
MGLVKNIEQKIKINRVTSIGCLVLSVIVVIAGFVFSYKQIQDARKSIYVLDNGVPVLVKQTDLLMNRPVEYKAQIDLFHSLFFTLSADDDYIREQTKKALYLIDDSGMKEYMNLKEKGFYNQIISSNSVMTVKADSIRLDEQNLKFIYYGTQTINRKTQLIVRKLVTEGFVKDIPRSPNNPHGVLIEKWKTLDNSDISVKEKFR